MYQIETHKRFEKQFKKLGSPIQKRIREEIEKLKANPNDCKVEPLKYELRSKFSLHIDDINHRVIFMYKNQNCIYLLAVGYRKKFYEDFKRYLKSTR